MSSLKPIGNIVVICCAFFIIFGILGVQVCGGPGPAISRDLSSGLPRGLDAVAPGAAATFILEKP